MSDIRAWLEELSLGQYSDAFESNDVGLDVLSTLTDADLKDLGVSLGNRGRILAAIGHLTDTSSHTQKDVAASRAARLPHAERRQITVMFCDLVGSTASYCQKLCMG